MVLFSVCNTQPIHYKHMYLNKFAAAIENSIDNDIVKAKDAIVGALPENALGRTALALPIVLGAYKRRNDKPIAGAIQGAGASAGAYAGYKGGKLLAEQLDKLDSVKGLDSNTQGLLRLAAIAAGTGLGSKMGWDLTGSVL